MRTYHYFSGLGSQDDFTVVRTSDVQRALRDRGFDPGPIDNLYGPRTEAAIYAAMERTGVLGPFVAARRAAQISIDPDAWRAILALSSGAGSGGATPSATPTTPRTPSIGPSLDPLATFTKNGNGAESGGINWGLVLGAGAIAFGIGWLFLSKPRKRGVSGLGRARRRRRRRSR